MASGNGISGFLNFKIFWGTMPPDPPRDWRHRRASDLAPAHKFLATAMVEGVKFQQTKKILARTETVTNEQQAKQLCDIALSYLTVSESRDCVSVLLGPSLCPVSILLQRWVLLHVHPVRCHCKSCCPGPHRV